MLLMLLLSVMVATFQPAAEPQAVVIRKYQAGSVTIGSSADDLYARFRGRAKLIDLALEGHLSPALELSFPETQSSGGVVAELIPKDNALIVWRIAVTNPRIKTESGLGVGSSVADLRSHYTVTGVGSGEGRVFVRVEELSASFELDRSGPGGDRLWQIRDPSRVPGDIKIVSILLTR